MEAAPFSYTVFTRKQRETTACPFHATVNDTNTNIQNSQHSTVYFASHFVQRVERGFVSEGDKLHHIRHTDVVDTQRLFFQKGIL